jgi:hypothetical protein
MPKDSLVQVNPIFLSENTETPLDVRLELVCEEAEIDEQWSFVEKKSNQRWLWRCISNATTINGHVNDFLFDARGTSIIAIVQHKSDRWAGVIFARVSLYILSVFA